jgi:hypothetical protein
MVGASAAEALLIASGGALLGSCIAIALLHLHHSKDPRCVLPIR